MQDFNDSNLRDPNLLNALFTWSNLTAGALYKRVDRFLCSVIGKLVSPSFVTRHSSDHCPIELDTSKLKWGLGPFRFKNTWLEHP
ncbi:hypothetical protein L3X38_036823 [Prunus dulcis]|uniref:DNAse I-like superfamily protein n=1 Tax=Prunus dulcis TaxID=3755 RepID=A0AAD4V410_PRUDU|nr:hypothetical protein L3X38_036823 [Prunus dulcis]